MDSLKDAYFISQWLQSHQFAHIFYAQSDDLLLPDFDNPHGIGTAGVADRFAESEQHQVAMVHNGIA